MAADRLTNTMRIVRMLQAFVPDNAPLSSHELRQRSGAAKSTFHGLLQALCQAGWLERCAHGRYRLGPRAETLAFLSALPLPPRVSPPRQASPSPGSAAPQPTLPALHPDVLKMQDTHRFHRLGPVRIGFVNASLSNPWRNAFMNSFLAQARRLESRIGQMILRHADDNPAQQARQIGELAAEGIDVLIISACDDSDLILSAEITRIAAMGIPVVAVDRRPVDMTGVTSFITANNASIGAMSALWLAEHLEGRGKIWLLSGRKEAVPAQRRLDGARMILEQFPGIEAAFIEHTDWTEPGGYAAAERIARAGAAVPAGVWCDSGLHGIGSIRWFLDHHGKAPPHTGGDQNLMYKLCLRHRIPFAAMDYPYTMGEQALSVALDILSGRPVPRRIEVPLAMVMPRGCQTKA